MAARHARGLLPLGEDFLHDGILATRFKGRLLAETQVMSGSVPTVTPSQVGEFPAVVPEICGRAWVTGLGSQVPDTAAHRAWSLVCRWWSQTTPFPWDTL